MASADQLKALLKSHLAGDERRFRSTALQLAAHEAKLGHGKLARELRDLIDQAQSALATGGTSTVSIARPRGDLAELLTLLHPKQRLADLVVVPALHEQLQRIVREHHAGAAIRSHGLQPRRKLLLVGPPGSGKTLSASVLAGELGLPLFLVRLDSLITRFMGETASKLRLVFEAMTQTRGVYFFDEFDAIGSQRGSGNDVGEIRRVLNSFLMMIEQDQSHSLLIAATNHPEVLDRALFRRFDDVLWYTLPDTDAIAGILRNRLSQHASKGVSWKRLAKQALGLSAADVVRAADDAIKHCIIEAQESVGEVSIKRALLERLEVHQQLHRQAPSPGD